VEIAPTLAHDLSFLFDQTGCPLAGGRRSYETPKRGLLAMNYELSAISYEVYYLTPDT